MTVEELIKELHQCNPKAHVQVNVSDTCETIAAEFSVDEEYDKNESFVLSATLPDNTYLERG